MNEQFSNQQKKMTLDYKHANEVIANKNNGNNILWLGDCAAAENIQWIRQHNIRVVITAAVGLDIRYDPSVRHYKYPIQDVKTQNMIQYFDEVAQKIQKGLKWGSVLVHCGAGVSRSATLVLAYLIKYHRMTFHQALKYTKSKRPEICPNLGFQLQLKKYAAPKALKSVGNTSQNFYKNSNHQWGIRTYLNQSHDSSNLSIPHISRIIPKTRQTQLVKQRQTQPKGWRISYNLKPQFASSSLDPKAQTNNYIKNLAMWRFGRTNASKWGIYQK